MESNINYRLLDAIPEGKMIRVAELAQMDLGQLSHLVISGEIPDSKTAEDLAKALKTKPAKIFSPAEQSQIPGQPELRQYRLELMGGIRGIKLMPSKALVYSRERPVRKY